MWSNVWSMEKRRIHFAGVGHREVERVVYPAQELKADRVYLLANEDEKAGDTRASAYRARVRELLAQKQIEAADVFTKLWDAPSVAHEVRRIVEAEPDGEFRFNVSTGPKPCVLGGFLASMFWKVRIYYVHVDYKRERDAAHESQYPAVRIEFLPTFKSEVPRPEVIAGLEVIQDAGGRVSQSGLLKELLERRIIRSKVSGTDLSPQAAHSQLQSILARQELLSFIERGTALQKGEIQITPEGEAGLRLFSEPSAPHK
jgi:hypothetical protein